MKKILLVLIILASTQIYSKPAKKASSSEIGIGANIQVHSESEKTESGGADIEVKDETMIFGGSFHNFKPGILEFEIDLFFGYNHADNGVSDTKQNFFGLGGGVNFHLLKKDLISAGFGARLGFENYMEPDRDPDIDYDSYTKYNAALEVPIFLDVKLHEHFLIRFSAVTAGSKYAYHSHKIEGVEESDYSIDFYTTTSSGTDNHNWFPVSIYFIYKF